MRHEESPGAARIVGRTVSTGAGGPAPADQAHPLWIAVDRLLESASLEGIVAHKVGPLDARRRRLHGDAVPPALRAIERAASLGMQAAIPLLQRIRASCDGPLLLIKGPEVACCYPGRARQFSDLDILTSDAASVHRSLLAAGFVIVPDEDEDYYVGHHHEPPLKWPTIWLRVEVHSRPNWPTAAEPPEIDELLEAAQPSALGVDGVSAPDTLHHALLVAAHAWRDEPLQTLRDLIDVAALATSLDERELDRMAGAFDLNRIWRTTRRAADALFYDGKPTVPLRLWARHLRTVRERTVFESHLERWLHAYWEVPAPAAVARTVNVLRTELTPSPGEGWTDKLKRASNAVRKPGSPVDRSGADSIRPRGETSREPPE